MAKNLFEVVQNLLIPFLMLAIVSSVNSYSYSKKIRQIYAYATAAVFALTLLMSVLRQWRIIKYNQINNIYLLCTALVAGLLYAAALFVYSYGNFKNHHFVAKKTNFSSDAIVSDKKTFILEIILLVLGILYVACLMLYRIPTVIFLPLQFLGIGESIFTTMYLLKITGFLLGWLACILTGMAFYKILRRVPAKKTSFVAVIFYALSAFIYFVAIIGIINSYYRKKIRIPTGLRKAIPQLITAENIVIFVIFALVAVIAVLFFLSHLKIHGEYENPAEHRLLRRFERDCRKWGLFAFVLAVFALVDITAIKKRANRIVELSPSESYEIEGSRIFIPLEQVSDGHLHRFSWENGKGKTVRFIIVQKQGTNFGIGFDACEVCGNVGYYERKNEVVCNRCDVVMNKNTIGLKGGCNPIPLVSAIEDGGIVIYTEDLDLEAGRF